MIHEIGVLLGIEDFQQGRGWISFEILADLVNLIEHEDRVFGLTTPDFLDDAAGERPYITAAVAPDLRLVLHTGQRDPDKFSLHAPGNGHSK